MCYHCYGNHKPETCRFKENECFYCKTKGHTTKVCCKKQKSAKNHSANQLNQFSDNSRKDFNNDYDDVLDMFQLTLNTNPPLKVTLLVNHTPITMEINTGASTSLINHDKKGAIKF